MILANWDNYFLLYFTFIFIATIFLDSRPHPVSLSLTFFHLMPLPRHIDDVIIICREKLWHNVCWRWHITLTSSNNMQGGGYEEPWHVLITFCPVTLQWLPPRMVWYPQSSKSYMRKKGKIVFKQLSDVFWHKSRILFFNLVKSQWNVSSEKIF